MAVATRSPSVAINKRRRGRPRQEIGGATGRGWVPGQSGNPHGRPRVDREWRELCREFADRQGFAEMKRLALDRKSRHQLGALELIIAYAHGRPPQHVEHSGELRALSLNMFANLSTEALEGWLRHIEQLESGAEPLELEAPAPEGGEQP